MQIFCWVCIVIEERDEQDKDHLLLYVTHHCHANIHQQFEYRLSIKILIRFSNFSVLSYHAKLFNGRSNSTFLSRLHFLVAL